MEHNHNDHHHIHTLNRSNNIFMTIVLNVGITVAQLIGGIISGSMALLSDALHNFSDVLSLVISYIATKLINKEPSIDKTFGYERAEVLAAFINSLTLLIIALILIEETIGNLFHPNKHLDGNIVIYLSILSIIFNGLSVLIIHKDSKESMNIKSSFVHLFSDMLTSIGVLIGGILIKYYNIVWVDSVVSLAISIYLITLSIGLLKSSSKILMQFAPAGISIPELEKVILNHKDIVNLHHLHIWQISEKDIILTGHLEFRNDCLLTESTKILQSIRDELSEKFNIKHTTFQSEIGTNDPKDLIITHE